MGGHTGRRRTTPALLGVGVATLAVLAVVLAVVLLSRTDQTSTPAASAPRSTPAAQAAAATPTASPAGSATAGAVPGPGGPGSSSSSAVTTPRGLRPVRIAIPAIGVDASMTDLGIASDGSIEVPSVPAQAGWLDTTPAPGEQGPAVVAGHVDSTTGPAVFYELSDLSTGDAIVVTRRDGSTARFTVDGVRTYPQDAFPTSEVYGPVPGPALRLITCGGDYVKADGGYQANVVVYAS